MPQSRSWCVDGPDGSADVYVYVQSDLGNFAFHSRIPPDGNVLEIDQRPHIAAGLSNAQVEALFTEQ
jgi:hypothetical protein